MGRHAGEGRGGRVDPVDVEGPDLELVARHGDWIKDEVLAVEIRLDSGLRIEKASSGE